MNFKKIFLLSIAWYNHNVSVFKYSNESKYSKNSIDSSLFCPYYNFQINQSNKKIRRLQDGALTKGRGEKH
jgi:hypothetical protein